MAGAESDARSALDVVLRNMNLELEIARFRGSQRGILLTGPPDKTTPVLDLVARVSGLPFVDVACETHDNHHRLCQRFIAAHEAVFGPFKGRGWDASSRARELLDVGRFTTLLRDPDRLTPQAAWRLSSWVKEPRAGLTLLVGPNARGILRKDPELLPNYLVGYEL